ncbi:MAG: hypothetical protein AABX49_00310 [Nanoarchaeota archaeon]
MNSNEITDLIVGFVVLLFGIIILAIGFDPIGDKSSNEGVKFSDEEKLFLLNYLRTDSGNGNLADMIALNENGNDESLKDLRGVSRNILNFYGFNGRDYALRVKYPNGDVKFIAGSQEGDLSSPEPRLETKFGDLEEYRTELGSGEKAFIPSLNRGLIIIELEVEDE